MQLIDLISTDGLRVFCKRTLFFSVAVTLLTVPTIAQNSVVLGGGKRTDTKTTLKPPDKKGKSVKNTRGSKPNDTQVSVVKNGRKNPNLPVKDQRVQATFMTGASGVEIFFDGEKIGTSDNNGRFKLFIPVGEHQIGARKYNKTLLEPTKFVIGEAQTNIDISGQVAKAIDELQASSIAAANSQASAAQPKVEPNINAQPLVEQPAAILNSDNILEAYIDPKRSDSITVQDWQRVYEQNDNLNGNDGMRSLAQGQLELANKSFGTALNLFDAAKILMPNNAAVYYAIGNAQIAAGSSTGAVEAFKKALSVDSRFGLAHLRLGEIYQSQGKTTQASQQFGYAEQLGVDVSKYKITKPVKEIAGNKRCSASIRELEETVKTKPNADSYIRLGSCYNEEKHPLKAIDALKEAVKLDNKSAVANYLLGLIYFDQKEYDYAEDAFGLALSLDPNGQTIDIKKLKKMIEKARQNSRRT